MDSTGGLSRPATVSANGPKSSRNKSSRKLTTWGLAVAGVFGIGVSMAASQPPKPRPLAANDVSILFPAPRNAKNLTNLIALSDLNGPAGSGRVWSDADFNGFLAIAEDPRFQVAGQTSRFNCRLRSKQIDAWFIAGIRIDPGAPGLSKDVIEQYGQQPQIRLIAQPVTRGPGGTIKVHDIAAHLIFSYSASEKPAADLCLPRPKPDMAAFEPVIRDTVALRDQLASGKFGKTKVNTAGLLNVHPGLIGASAVPFRNALKGFLETHLASARLSAMAIMGLALPGALDLHRNGETRSRRRLLPVPGPTLDGAQFAQMLNRRTRMVAASRSGAGDEQSEPDHLPARRTSKAAAAGRRTQGRRHGRIHQRQGVGRPRSRDRRHHRRSEEEPLLQYRLHQLPYRHRPAIGPVQEQFQSRRRRSGGAAERRLERQKFRLVHLVPQKGPAVPTATRRTATETAEVVEFINRELLGK